MAAPSSHRLSRRRYSWRYMKNIRASTRLAVFWLGVDREIEDMVKPCHQYLAFLPGNCKKPLLRPPLPTRPWEKLGIDLCNLNGHEYLIITDYFSSSTEVRALKTNSKASLIIREVKDAFSCFGNPIEAVTDGGPQFKSNGKAKAAVKNVKKLLKKCGSMNDKFWKGTQAIRYTLLSCGKSPSQLYLAEHCVTLTGWSYNLICLSSSLENSTWKHIYMYRICVSNIIMWKKKVSRQESFRKRFRTYIT